METGVSRSIVSSVETVMRFAVCAAVIKSSFVKLSFIY